MTKLMTKDSLIKMDISDIFDKFELSDEDKEKLKKSLREKIKPGDLIYRR